MATSLHAAIYRWLGHELIPGTENITPGPGVDLSGWNADPHSLRFALLRSLDLHAANFSGSDLTYAFLNDSNLSDADFTNAVVKNVHFTGTNLSFSQLSSTASFQQHDLSGIQLSYFNLTGWDLAGQSLSGGFFVDANLTNANLSNCDLGAVFIGATLVNASLARSRFGGGDLEGADFSNADLSNTTFDYTWLNYANFTNANFSNATLSNWTNLSFAGGLTFNQLASTSNYRRKDFSSVLFNGLNLSGADFSGQTFADASFSYASFTNVNFAAANLTHTNFCASTLTNVNFVNAVLDRADFRDAIDFNPAGAASTNGTIFPDGAIPVLHLTDGQFFMVENTSTSPVRITAAAPSIGTGATLEARTTLYGPSLLVDGALSGFFGNLHVGHLFGNGTLSLGSSDSTAGAIRLQALYMLSSNLQIAPDSPISSLSTLVIGGSTNDWTSTLDLNGNALIIQPDPDVKAESLATLQNQVAYGRTHPAGITSSTLPPDTALAVLDNAVTQFPTFGGLPVDNNSLLISPQLLGDANADGHVDLSDLVTVLKNFGEPTPNWTSGNFDGATTINLTDLSFILNNFGLTTPTASSQLPFANPQLPATPTPEPTTLGLLLAPAIWSSALRRLSVRSSAFRRRRTPMRSEA
ncbi:MAG: pentapeptide repeat-containing protein [Phycisphaerae bacterium]